MAFSFNGNTPRKIIFNNQDVKKLIYNNNVVWEKERLPVEYQEVEYIESTGTQYIDTGIVLNNGCVITLDFLIAESSVNRIVYGWRRKGTYTGLYQAYITSNTRKIRSIIIGRSSNDTYPQSFEYGVRNKVLIDSVNKQVLVNDTVIDCGANFNNGRAFDENGSSEYHPYLFALNNAGKTVAISEDTRIYGYSVQYGDELLQSFIPCYRKIDNVAGMYDVVNDVFYTNDGTGEFNVGADIITIPTDYQRVEYIRSTSDGGQWIDTGVPGENSNLRIDVSYMWDVVPAGGSYQNIISAYINETSNCTRIIQYGAGYTYVDVNIRANRSPAYRSARVAGTRYNDSLTRTYYDVNGERLVLTETVTGSSNNHNLHLFSSSTHSAFAKSLRLYNCKLYDGNTIVRDFVPCYRKIDNVAGMYDVVNDVFYTNSGSGTFLKGDEIIELPEEYQRLTYIKSTGTQYIDTNYTPNQNTKAYTKFNSDTLNSGLYSSSNKFTAYINTNGNWRFGSTTVRITPSIGVLYTSVQDKTGVIINETDVYNYDGTVTDFTSTATLRLMFNSTGFKGKIYEFKLYDNDILVRNFIPCYRKSDNVAGMYDIVSGKFFTNDGTGSFAVGNNI